MCVMRSVDVRPSDVRRQLGIEARRIELRLLAITSQSPPARGAKQLYNRQKTSSKVMMVRDNLVQPFTM